MVLEGKKEKKESNGPIYYRRSRFVSCMYLRIMMMINKKSRNIKLFCEFESSSFIFCVMEK